MGKKFNFNTQYFSEIDTQEKAYFLGLIFADGNISKSKYQLRLGFKQEDAFLATRFAEALGHNGALRERAIDSFKSVLISSKNLCRDLIELGCVPKKSLILTFPKLRRELIPHFVRGYFDGDGSIYCAKITAPLVTIVGAPLFLQEMNQQIAEGCGIGIKTLTSKRGKIWKTYRFSGRKQVEKFGRWLYNDAMIYLPRKKERIDFCT